MAFDYRPVTLDVDSGDNVGLLVFRDGALLAVVAQLSALHGDQAGWWFAEFVFNPSVEKPSRPFTSIEHLEAWLQVQIG